MSEKHIPPYNDASGRPVPGPDRDERAGRKLTWQQKLARRTNGIGTLATGLSALGVGLTAAGCELYKRGHYGSGVGCMAVGVACDFIDGKVARACGVDGYAGGRYADIGLDGVKAIMVAKLGLETGDFPIVPMALTFGPKLAGWAVNGASKFILKNEPTTSPEGRIGEASRWIAPLGFFVGNTLSHYGVNDDLAANFKATGWTASLVAAGFGIKAVAGYVKSAYHSQRAKKEIAEST
jgi:hypothetical protein